MKFFCPFILLSILTFQYGNHTCVSAQNSQDENLISATFTQKKQVETKRKALNLKGKSWKVKINPLTYLGVGLLYFYQNMVSEQISADCSYQISCSENAKKAIEKYGLIKGVLLGAHQLNACFPAVRKEHADHAVIGNGKVFIHLKDYD
jgi:putative component of membrane protein insertase Oxa1/YidC/SpoIIIJ protein YidD